MELKDVKFEIEIEKDENLPKGTLYISMEDGSSAKYTVANADEVGQLVADFIRKHNVAITIP